MAEGCPPWNVWQPICQPRHGELLLPRLAGHDAFGLHPPVVGDPPGGYQSLPPHLQ
jgi:hypothetical protein